ncbi:MAG: TfoX/Sxy family protein [Verrucomicrobia bacterium]|nr:TfoX/Sxy family protein [Verrucomicrobiota bacterium]
MAYDEQLAERIRRGFSKSRVRFEEKHMMGGLCFMVDGKMCVGVEKNRLMARIDPAVYDTALRRKGCVPMDFTGRPMRGFVFVNPAGLATDGELDDWLKLALAFNPNAKASKKKSAQKLISPSDKRETKPSRQRRG